MDGVPFGVLSGLANLDVPQEQTLARLRNFAFAFLEEHAESQGKSRWAEKTAINAFHLDQIELFCGDHVMFVCLVRHGLDVVCSLRDLSERGHCYLSEIHEYVKMNPRPLEAFAQAWVDTSLKIHAFVERHPDNSILVRYEDLVSNPQEQITQIMRFLGESIPDKYLETALQDETPQGFGDWKTFSKSSVDEASVGRWKELSQNTIAVLSKVVNPTLSILGYDTVESSPPDTDEQALRRYNFAMNLQKLKNQS